MTELTDGFMAALADHNVKSVGRHDGDLIDVLGVRQCWKVRARDTGYAFSIYEMTLAPGQGVPLHAHPFAESFYVLDGEIDFARVGDDRQVEWLRATGGESVNAPINAPHGFLNRGDQPARLLSTSTYYHEAIFEQAGVSVVPGDAIQPVTQADLELFGRAAAAHQGVFLEVPDSGRIIHIGEQA